MAKREDETPEGGESFSTVKLTPKERDTKGHELASKVLELLRMKEDNRDEKKAMKAKEEALEKEIKRLADGVKTGVLHIPSQQDLDLN